MAVSLKTNNLVLNKVEDLAPFSIASFQMAPKLLDAEFQNVADKSPSFIEISNQEKQVNILLHNKADVLIIDRYIFAYYCRHITNKECDDIVDYHYLFPKSQYSLAFTDKTLVAEFNKKLSLFLSSTAYKALRTKYHFTAL